jgi:ectoine hydroxylase-related dioxygenase (phytanoyl-CoA dioxygenase family)
MPVGMTISAIAGSHLAPASAYPYTQTTSPDVTKGSGKHLLGYAYAPRLLSPSLAERVEPVPLVVGQAMIFGLALVHGGGANLGQATRFSSDIRIVNPYVPVRRNRGVDSQYFVPLCRSAISRAAERYLAAELSSEASVETGGKP